MLYPKLGQYSQSRRVIQKFSGFDRTARPAEGALVEMENLTSDQFPALSPRAKRGSIITLKEPNGMASSGVLAYVDGSSLYIDRQAVSGLTLSTNANQCPKTLISMGAYLLIFPDKKYVNTADLTEYGSLDNVRTLMCSGDSYIQYSLCQSDGTVYGSYTSASTPPDQPENGEYWLDTAVSPNVLRCYDSEAVQWVEVPSVYIRIEMANIGVGFSAGDGVTISGAAVSSANGATILQAVGSSYLVIPGLLRKPVTQSLGIVTISRKAPDMDYVTECGNRLWGCKYGAVNGKMVNEIYASALGDFKNWNKFQGLSTDSYAATRGSGGPWTGAITHLGCPLFFKESCIEKIYPDSGGAHEIVTVNCRGVAAGSSKSLALVGEILYYQSPWDICAYDGSLPVSVSRPLGDLVGKNAVAGSLGNKYYISFTDKAGASHLLVYDTARNLWHREDGLKAVGFCQTGTALYCLDANARLLSIDGTQGKAEADIHWSAQTGSMGLDRVEEKFISRLELRLELGERASADVYVQYDSSGVWEHGAHLQAAGTGSQVIPILPRRCDHFALRLEGQGDCRLYSVSAIMENGSDVQWP